MSKISLSVKKFGYENVRKESDKKLCESQKCVDINEEFNLPFLGGCFKALKPSDAAKKRLNLNLKVIKIKSESTKQSPSLLINNMKKQTAILDSNQSISTVASSGTNIEYLFVSDKKVRGDKERRISDFLNYEGIFQIHMPIALKELKKSTFASK